jgi:hypothetical protein
MEPPAGDYSRECLIENISMLKIGDVFLGHVGNVTLIAASARKPNGLLERCVRLIFNYLVMCSTKDDQKEGECISLCLYK